jgi:TRAP-type C4-dicarboxylate transport system substrate-binding protein
METTVNNENLVQLNGNADEYRKGVMELIESEVRIVIDEEMKKAAQELLEEQRKAIKQIVDEHRAVIREVVEQEKKAAWSRAEELRKSILKLGLR